MVARLESKKVRICEYPHVTASTRITVSDTAGFEPTLADFFLGQAKGSALSLYAWMKASMCSCNCSRLVKEAPLSDWPCKMENQISV